MKKMIAIILSLTMTAALVACSESRTKITEKKLTTVSKEAEPVAKITTVEAPVHSEITEDEKKTMTDAAMLSVSAAMATEKRSPEDEKVEKAKADEPEKTESGITALKTEEKPAVEEPDDQRNEFDEMIDEMSDEELEAALNEILGYQVPSIDKNIYDDLQSVLDKYGIDVSTLIELTGLSDDVFYYNWNNCDNQKMKSTALNYLFGKNYFENTDKTNLVTPNSISIKPIQAYWDDDGALHIICSLKSGYRGMTYNISVDDFEVYSNGDLIAVKSFGYITEPAVSGEPIQAVKYDKEFYYEFVFDGDSVTEPYANIMNNIYIGYKTNSRNYYEY